MPAGVPMLPGGRHRARAWCPCAAEDGEHPVTSQRSWAPAALSAGRLRAARLSVAVMLPRG